MSDTWNENNKSKWTADHSLSDITLGKSIIKPHTKSEPKQLTTP